MKKKGIVNINVGVLGHVDSGKTSLVRRLSTCLSTAALDKHPQSQARGITLDLGFSSFLTPMPSHWITRQAGKENEEQVVDLVQVTLVDCPGHASLIKTIIGGTSIIDLVLLVMDVTKGIQAQTVECLVLAEITTTNMVVVLNKVDLIPPGQREQEIARRKTEVDEFLQKTHFKNLKVPMYPVTTMTAASNVPEEFEVKSLVNRIMDQIQLPKRHPEGDLLFAADHCFQIKGKGTILTGTVLQGTARVNDVVEIPTLKIEKKIKSMQMFHQEVTSASQGDRVGICFVGLNPALIERGMVAAPKSIQLVSTIVAAVRKISFCSLQCSSRAKFHLSVGHSTTMTRVLFFRHKGAFEHTSMAPSLPQPMSLSTSSIATGLGSQFSMEKEYQYENELEEDGASNEFYVLLRFDSPILCPRESTIIGSRLDTEVSKNNQCRLAFYGKCVYEFDPHHQDVQTTLEQLKISKLKERSGAIEKLVETSKFRDEKNGRTKYREVVGRGLFKKETDMTHFVGLRILVESTGEVGTIGSAFGKSGKFKVLFPQGTQAGPADRLILRFSKYVFDSKKKLTQNTDIYSGLVRDEHTLEKATTEEVVADTLHGVSITPRQTREGIIERLKGETTSDGRNPCVIAIGLFHTYEEAEQSEGLQANTSFDEYGVVGQPFGKQGKVRVNFESGTKAAIGDKIWVNLMRK